MAKNNLDQTSSPEVKRTSKLMTSQSTSKEPADILNSFFCNANSSERTSENMSLKRGYCRDVVGQVRTYQYEEMTNR